MTPEATSAPALSQLLRVRDGLIVHQALYAAAKLGVADLLKDGPEQQRNLQLNCKSMNRHYTEFAGACEPRNLRGDLATHLRQ